MLVTLISFGSGLPKELDKKGDEHLFMVTRCRNTDVIMYDLNLDRHGNVVNSAPLKIYWIKKTQNNKIEPLTWIQKKYAYGIKFIKGANLRHDEWAFEFVSYPGRIFKLRQIEKRTFKVYTNSNNKEAVISRIFIQIDGGSYWIPSISAIKLYLTDPYTGYETTETIKP